MAGGPPLFAFGIGNPTHLNWDSEGDQKTDSEGNDTQSIVLVIHLTFVLSTWKHLIFKRSSGGNLLELRYQGLDGETVVVGWFL